MEANGNDLKIWCGSDFTEKQKNHSERVEHVFERDRENWKTFTRLCNQSINDDDDDLMCWKHSLMEETLTHREVCHERENLRICNFSIFIITLNENKNFRIMIRYIFLWISQRKFFDLRGKLSNHMKNSKS